MDAPVKLVIDCSNAGGPPAELIDRLRGEALELLAAGEPEAAANVIRQAQEAANANALGVERLEPLTEEELDQLEVDRAAHEQQEWQMLRDRRNALLAHTDWTQLADARHRLGARADAWDAYRQELRDLPSNISHPHAAEWPTPPEAA